MKDVLHIGEATRHRRTYNVLYVSRPGYATVTASRVDWHVAHTIAEERCNEGYDMMITDQFGHIVETLWNGVQNEGI